MRKVIAKLSVLAAYVVLGAAVFCLVPGMKAEAVDTIHIEPGDSGCVVKVNSIDVGNGTSSYGVSVSVDGKVTITASASYDYFIHAGVTIYENRDTVTENHGVIENNTSMATVTENYGVVINNAGQIDTNGQPGSSGTVENNSGTITTNYGVVNVNSSSHRIDYNWGTVFLNSGTVQENRLRIGKNTGTVDSNYPTGTISQNEGSVSHNEGHVYRDTSGGGVHNEGSGDSTAEDDPNWDYSDHSDGGNTGSRRNKKHSDSSKDYKYVEVDGQLVYGGLVDGVFAPASFMIPASAYPKFNDWVVKKLEKALASETEDADKVSISCSVWNSLPSKVMQAMNEYAKDIELIYKAADGNQYSIMIPAGCNVMQYVDENGYCGLSYLGSNLGQVPYVTE